MGHVIAFRRPSPRLPILVILQFIINLGVRNLIDSTLNYKVAE
jgi:hypothetical protein